MLPGFIATTKALTPVGRVERAAARCPRSEIRQVSLLNTLELLTIPPPTTASPFRYSRFVTLRSPLQLVAPIVSRPLTGLRRPSSDRRVRSRVHRMPGSSPTGLAEMSSLSLRTGHSSQVAPHPPSRKRSYHCRLQAGNVSLDGTFTRLFKRLHRRTSRHSPSDEARPNRSRTTKLQS